MHDVLCILAVMNDTVTALAQPHEDTMNGYSSVTEAAKKLGVSRSTVLRLIKSGEIANVRRKTISPKSRLYIANDEINGILKTLEDGYQAQ